MRLVYFDESGNTGPDLANLQQPVFVLGALCVPEDRWRGLEMDLEQAILDRFPRIHATGTEIHGMDLRNAGKKSPFAGARREDRDSLRDAWLGIAASHNLSFYFRGVVKKNYKDGARNLSTGDLPDDPQFLAFGFLATHVLRGLNEIGARGLFISDTSEKDTLTEQIVRHLRLSPGAGQLTNIVEKGFFIDSAKSRVLQLCDVCTLYARKGIESDLGAGAANVATATSDAVAATKLKPLTEGNADARYDSLKDWLVMNFAGGHSN